MMMNTMMMSMIMMMMITLMMMMMMMIHPKQSHPLHSTPLHSTSLDFYSSTQRFSVSPALPSGLSLNTYTGRITGTPTAISSEATFTVTIHGLEGTASQAIEVDEAWLAPVLLFLGVDVGGFSFII
jgi:hypothetical protein